LNAHEPELLAEQLRELVGETVPVRYEKLFTAADGTDLLRRLPAHLAQPGVTALVFNFIDQLTHGRSENAILYEVARDADALRGLTKTWFERSPVLAALEEAERRNVPVLLTTDHGSIHCNTPATVFAKRDATANLRYKFGEDLRAEDPEAAIMVEDLKAYGLPAKGLGVRLLLATGDRFFVYPTKLREYQARYRGAFLHGGATPEEMILPVALLLENLAAYFASMGSVAIQEGVVRDLRVRLFDHLQTLPLGYFQRTRAGQTIARVISDTDQVKTAVSAALASLLQNVVVILVYVAILFGLSVKLTLLSLLLAPVLLLIIRPMINRLRRRSRELAAERGEVTSHVGEMIASAKLVRAYVAEAFELGRFAELAERYRRRVLRAQRYSSLTSPVSEVFGGVMIVLILVVGTRLALGAGATLDPAVLITFLAVSLRLMSPIKSVSNYPAIMATAVASAERVFEVLDLPAAE